MKKKKLSSLLMIGVYVRHWFASNILALWYERRGGWRRI